MQREPIGLELVQPTENHGDSDREEDSAPPMVAVHTHHGDQGKVCKEFVRKVKNLFMKNQISYEKRFLLFKEISVFDGLHAGTSQFFCDYCYLHSPYKSQKKAFNFLYLHIPLQ